MKLISSLSFTLLLAGICAMADAAPAHWYQWRSKTDGAVVCANVPLGAGWERAAGPFRDSHCEKRVLAQ